MSAIGHVHTSSYLSTLPTAFAQRGGDQPALGRALESGDRMAAQSALAHMQGAHKDLGTLYKTLGVTPPAGDAEREAQLEGIAQAVARGDLDTARSLYAAYGQEQARRRQPRAEELAADGRGSLHVTA